MGTQAEEMSPHLQAVCQGHDSGRTMTQVSTAAWLVVYETTRAWPGGAPQCDEGTGSGRTSEGKSAPRKCGL